MKIKLLLICCQLFCYYSVIGQDIYEYKEIHKSKKNKKMLSGKKSIYLSVNNDSLCWVDFEMSNNNYKSNYFKYEKLDTKILFKYFDFEEKKWIEFPQFTLNKDTINYMDENQLNNINIIGKSYYYGDTIINFKKKDVECYIFHVFNNLDGENMRTGIFKKIILIDKNNFLPIQIISRFYNRNSELIKTEKIMFKRKVSQKVKKKILSQIKNG